MWNRLAQQLTQRQLAIVSARKTLSEKLTTRFNPFLTQGFTYLSSIKSTLSAFFMPVVSTYLYYWHALLRLLEPTATLLLTTLPRRIISTYSNGELPGLVLSTLPDWAIVRSLVQTFRDYDAGFRAMYDHDVRLLKKYFPSFDPKEALDAALFMIFLIILATEWSNDGIEGVVLNVLLSPLTLANYIVGVLGLVIDFFCDFPQLTLDLASYIGEVLTLVFYDLYFPLLDLILDFKSETELVLDVYVIPALDPFFIVWTEMPEGIFTVFDPFFIVWIGMPEDIFSQISTTLAWPFTFVLSTPLYKWTKALGPVTMAFFYLLLFFVNALIWAFSLLKFFHLLLPLLYVWLFFHACWLDYLSPLLTIDGYVYLYLSLLILFVIVSLLFSMNLISTSTYQAYLGIKALLFLIFTLFSGLYFTLPANEAYLWSPTVVLNTTTVKIPILALGVSKISYFFSSLVLFILFGVLSFAYPYMLKEQKKFKFTILLFFFASSMLLFFHAKTLVSLILAWKLIGVTSFFLIGHYNTKVSVFKSSFKAMLFNIFSDLVFALFVALYFKVYGTLEIRSLEGLRAESVMLNFFYFEVTSATLLGLLLFVFAAVKSAQGLNYVWLLDSMEAPVPASSLIHSATLVVTGVYLSATLGAFFVISPFVLTLVILTLLATAFIASFCACYQKDLKKALAFSTISNTSLAFLGTITGIEEDYVTLAISHGLIKSLCFLICGYFFFFNNHSQDVFSFSKPRTRALSYLFLFLFFIFSAAPISPFYSSKHTVAAIASALGTTDVYLVGCFMTGLGCLSAAYGTIIIGRLMLQEPRGYSSASTQDPREELASKAQFLLIGLFTFIIIVLIVYSALIILSGSLDAANAAASDLLHFIEDALFEDGGSFFFLIIVLYLFYKAMWPEN